MTSYNYEWSLGQGHWFIHVLAARSATAHFFALINEEIKYKYTTHKKVGRFKSR